MSSSRINTQMESTLEFRIEGNRVQCGMGDHASGAKFWVTVTPMWLQG
uniref:Uncharacterized protein n=1 Tax=Setaria italica TaxID=4555 RepID=K4A423_SETIT